MRGRHWFVFVVVVVVFTLKTVLTSIQSLLFLTLKGEETNFRGHKLPQNKVQKKKTQRESPNTCEKNIRQVPKNNKFRKTRSRLGQKTPKRKKSPSLQTRKLSHKQNILHRSTNTVKKMNLKRKLSPLPYKAGECSSSGFRRPGHPHSTPWSCERAKTKLTTHIMQDSTLCPRQYLHAPLLCRGALCRVSHQPGKHPPNTQVLGCEGGRATRMALMLPLRRYGIKTKTGLTRGKRSGQTRS